MKTPQVIVQIDTREQAPLTISKYPVEVCGLPVGDYGIKGFSDWSNPAFTVEWKTLNDLIGSLTQGRERFMREVEKLRAFYFAAILIGASEEQVARGDYVSRATPSSILATLDAIRVRTGVHIIWGNDATQAAQIFERLVRQFVRGIEKDIKRLGLK